MTVVGSRAPVPDEVRRRLDGAAHLLSSGDLGPASTDADAAYLAVVRGAVADAGPGVAEVEVSGPWIRVEPPGDTGPAQGWKLHVSAALDDDLGTLERVAPLLAARRVAWKVAASPAVLSGLNQGEAGLSQIGKFVTVYPRDDSEAVAVARLLDDALSARTAPRVPSDRRVRAGSVVSYRYGGFDGREVTGPSGELLPAVADPTGRLVPDHRGSTYSQPSWVEDPFEAEGLGEPSEARLVAGRFLLTSVLSRSPRGSVSLGIDLDSRTSCVVKQAARGAAHSPWGRDAVDLLRHEERVLRSLSGHPAVPRVVVLVADGDDVHLAMEMVEGVTLAQHVARRTNDGNPPSWDDVVSWCRDVVGILEHVHSRGLVYRDLKAANALVGSAGTVRLVDFEMAASVGAPGDGTVGSRGYCSPQQVGGAAASPADDVWSLGALIYFLVTGAEPAVAPDPFDLLSRPMSDLAPGVPLSVSELVGSCLALEAADRPADVGAVLTALEDAVGLGTTATPRRLPVEAADAFTEERRAVAQRLTRSLAEATRRWATRGTDLRTVDLSLYSGAAGELYALAELTDGLSMAEHEESVVRAARALTTLPVEPGTGLYHGDAGVGVALARAGTLLGDGRLVEAGRLRVAGAVASPAPGSDLVSGLAGQVRACQLVGEALGDQELLAAAERLAHELVGRARVDDGAAWWPEHGTTYLGYAHGVAGIADVLLDVAEMTGDQVLRDVVVRAGSLLLSQARAFGDGSRAAWTDVADGHQSASMWCHGATGITRFLHHLATSGGGEHVADAARAGLRTVMASRAGLGPVLCHGLAGSLELALDLGDEVDEADVRSLTRLLDAFAWDVGGRLVYLGDSPTQATSGLMTGYAGIALTQARLADRSRVTPVSRAAVRSQAPGR